MKCGKIVLHVNIHRYDVTISRYAYAYVAYIAYSDAKLLPVDQRATTHSGFRPALLFTLHCRRRIVDSDPPRPAGDSAFTVDIDSC